MERTGFGWNAGVGTGVSGSEAALGAADLEAVDLESSAGGGSVLDLESVVGADCGVGTAPKPLP